jgi:hypothetical protein
MPAWSKVLGDRPIRGEKPLRVPRGFKPLHALFALAGGLVGMLRTVVEVPMLAVLDPRQYLPLGRAIALELIRDDHPRDILTAFEELAEELLGRLLVPPSLHQDIEYHAILIHGPPQIVALFVDGDEHLIQMPFITRARTAPPQGIRIRLAKLATPLADRFVRHDDPPDKQELFDVAMAEGETEIPPDAWLMISPGNR